MKPNVFRGSIPLVLILTTYILLNYSSTHLDKPLSDSWIYMNSAKAILGGYIPYRDFFYAHQPLFIYLLALFYQLFGVSVASTKIYAIVMGVMTLYVTYLLGEHIKKYVGLVALILLTANYVFTGLSTEVTGTLQALAFGLTSIYLYFKGNKFWSGFSMGLSLLTRTDAILLLAVMVFACLRDGRKSLSFFKGLAVTGFVFLSLTAFMPNYTSNTIMYHIKKLPTYYLKEKSLALSKLTGYSSPLIVLSLAGILYVAYKYRKDVITLKVTLLTVSLLAVLVNLAYFLVSDIFFIHYFMYGIPFLALIGGYFLLDVLKPESVEKESFRRWFLVALILLVYVSHSYDIGLKKLSTPFKPNPLTPVIDIIKSESKAGDMIFDFESSSFVLYLSFITDRSMPPKFIDTTIHRARLIDPLEYESALKDKRIKIVLWNLKSSPYRSLPNFNDLSGYVKDSFYVRHVLQYDDNFFFLGEREFNPSQKIVLREPDEGEKILYRTGTYSEGKFIPSQEARVAGVNSSVVKYLMDPRKRLLAEDHPLLKRPLSMPSHWTTERNGVISDSWVTGLSGRHAEVLTVTYDTDSREYTSFIQLLYDSQSGGWTKLYVFELVGSRYLLRYLEELS